MADDNVTDEDLEIGSVLSDTYFSSTEKTQLKKIQDIRFALIDKLVYDEDGKVVIPGPTSEKLLLADLLNNASKDNKDRAKLRIASKATDVAGINSIAVAEVLRRHRNISQSPVSQEDRELPSHIKPENIVPGEMSIGVESVSIHEILASK